MQNKLVPFFYSLAIALMIISLPSCDSVQQVMYGSPTPTPTWTKVPTGTPKPTRTSTPTKTPNLAATQKYETFYAFVERVYEAGQISSLSTVTGSYRQPEDFAYDHKMDFGWVGRETGISARNFIVRADFNWSVTDQKNYSGCGFVFRHVGDNFNADFYLIILDALDGVKLSIRSRYYDYSIQGSPKTSLPDMGSNPYQANFALVVNENKAYSYINDVFYSEHTLKTDKLTESGALIYAVMSGSEEGGGASCEITNTVAWIVEK